MSDEMMVLLGCLWEEGLPYPWDGMVDVVGTGADWVGDDAEFDRDLGDRALRFYGNLDHLFTPIFTPALQLQRLKDCCGAAIPLENLAEILKTYQNLLAQGLPKGEWLLQGLRELLPQWSLEDLGLLVRPHGVAFRGGGAILLQVSEKSWEQLSEVERAQMVVAIAHFVVTELDELSKE